MKQLLFLFACCACIFIGCSKTDDLPEITITSVNPEKAKVNMPVQIIGSGFSALVPRDSSDRIKVFLGDVWATAHVVNDTILEFIVPPGAASGIPCVEWRGQRYCATRSFTVLPGNSMLGTFMKLPDYPGHYFTGYMFAIANSLYVGDIQGFWRFNTENHQWTRAANAPEWATRTTAVVVNGKGYVFGGLTATGGNGNNQLWQYDPQTNQWLVKAPMPSEVRFNSVSFAYNNKIYIAGGYNTNSQSTVPTQLWEYDLSTDQWQQKPTLLAAPVMETGVYRLQNKFYMQVSGGTLEYDPQSGQQRLLPGGVSTYFGAIHSSMQWNMAYIINGGGNNSVIRLFLGNDDLTFITQSLKSPIDPGTKPIRLFASLGEELFFFSQDHNSQVIDFWSYLPE